MVHIYKTLIICRKHLNYFEGAITVTQNGGDCYRWIWRIALAKFQTFTKELKFELVILGESLASHFRSFIFVNLLKRILGESNEKKNSMKSFLMLSYSNKYSFQWNPAEFAAAQKTQSLQP